jgi:hypothetical protein
MRRHSGFLQASLCMLLVGASLLLVQAQDTGYPRYSPCAPWTLVNKASSLVESPTNFQKPQFVQD